MRVALAVIVAFYSLLALGDYHEATVVTPMQIIMGLSIIPMCIVASGLMFSGLTGLSSKERRLENILIAVLAATLLVVVGYREFRRSKRPRSEAIPYNPQAANTIEATDLIGMGRVIGASRSQSPDPKL